MQTHLLTTEEAAEYLGISMAFLERDRWAGARAYPLFKWDRVRYAMNLLRRRNI